MNAYDIYLYGMVLITTSHLLKNDYPEPDSYAEIAQTYHFPGGETGSCATVLASLGASVKMDGNHMGINTYDRIKGFYESINVDISRLTNARDYEGLEDLVLIGKTTRTIFGKFTDYFENGEKRWNTPREEDIKTSTVIGLDPFFQEASELAAQYCREYNKKYVTIDCKYDSPLHQYSEVNVVSNEFIQNNYPGEDAQALFRKYTDNSEGLVIFTFGSRDILYGRKGEGIYSFTPYKVDVVSTLGAGDSFKAGAVYALLQGMTDPEIVSFASATAAVACSSFPLWLNPPTLKKISALQAARS